MMTWRSKSKDWLARNQDNVSKWSDTSPVGLLFQWASTIKIQLSVLVKYNKNVDIQLSVHSMFLD
jgi:hypothetical protein